MSEKINMTHPVFVTRNEGEKMASLLAEELRKEQLENGYSNAEVADMEEKIRTLFGVDEQKG